MPDSFRDARFSPDEEKWLDWATLQRDFDPRLARAALHLQIQRDFDPQKIDPRFYQDHRPTLLARRIFNPEDRWFAVVDGTLTAIKRRILANPGIDLVKGISINPFP